MPSNFRDNLERLASPLTFRLVTSGKDFYRPLPLESFRPVSIVIPSYNDINYLKPLLKSIKQTCGNFEYEVIISDDYCDPENNAQLKLLSDDRTSIVLGDVRRGFAGAVNRGIAQARWDVVLLNSDMVALPNWLQNLQYAAYEIDPLIGLVSPQLLYPSGRIQYGGTFHARVIAPQWFSHLDQGRFANFPSANVGKYMRGISGAAVYIKHNALEALGGLDENYWLGFEDVDLAFNARKLGFRCYFEPRSKLVHLESATRGKIQGPREYASMRLFWKKWTKAQQDFGVTKKIDFLHSSKSSFTVKKFAEISIKLLNEDGFSTEVHEADSNFRTDEIIISKLKNISSAKIALDHQCIETAWLAAENTGTPAFLFLGKDASELDLSNAEHRALLKPELSYLAANRKLASELANGCPWEIHGPISLPYLPMNLTTGKQILILDAPQHIQEILSSQLGVPRDEVSLLCWQDFESDFEKHLVDIKPRLILCFKEFESSFIPLSILAAGIALVTAKTEAIQYEVLDGFNSFTFERQDYDRAVQLVINLLKEPSHLDCIIKNGKQTATSSRSKFSQNFIQQILTSSNELLPHV